MKTKLLLLLFAFPFFAIAQSSREDLVKDFVKVVKGKMTMTDYTLLKQGESSTQIKMYAEAPATGVISRDYFISVCKVMANGMIEAMKTNPAATTKTLKELIGNADVEINMFVTRSGIQVKTKGVKGTNIKTIMWEEMFQE